MEAKFFIKGPKKSNQSSNLTSQRMVTESRFMTLLNRQQFSEQILTIMCPSNPIKTEGLIAHNKKIYDPLTKMFNFCLACFVYK